MIRTAGKIAFIAAIHAIAVFVPCVCVQGAAPSVCIDDGSDLDPGRRVVDLEHLWTYETGG